MHARAYTHTAHARMQVRMMVLLNKPTRQLPFVPHTRIPDDGSFPANPKLRQPCFVCMACDAVPLDPNTESLAQPHWKTVRKMNSLGSAYTWNVVTKHRFGDVGHKCNMCVKLFDLMLHENKHWKRARRMLPCHLRPHGVMLNMHVSQEHDANYM
jgi:hypothetical protein